MGFLSSLFQNDSIKFKPDYRDTILFNGSIPFRATGIFKDDLIEFEKIGNPSEKIYFNSNLNPQKYIDSHLKYDLVRNKDGSMFNDFEITMTQGIFVPTGRTFINEAGLGKLWEFMKKNDPRVVIYYKLPFNENVILGIECLDINKSKDSTSMDNKDIIADEEDDVDLLDLIGMNPVTMYNLGLEETKNGNDQKAIEYFTKAIKIYPQLTEAYYNRANAYYRIDLFHKALLDYDKVMVLDPNNADALCNRGISKYYLGDYEGTREDLHQAIALGSEQAKSTIRQLNI